jgi:hypothetical protein
MVQRFDGHKVKFDNQMVFRHNSSLDQLCLFTGRPNS